jgi:hypothetical protein
MSAGQEECFPKRKKWLTDACLKALDQVAGQSHPWRKTTSAVHEHWAGLFEPSHLLMPWVYRFCSPKEKTMTNKSASNACTIKFSRVAAH